MSLDEATAAIHENRLLATERVAHINGRSCQERVGPWLLVDTAEPEFAMANSATPLTSEVKPDDIAIAVGWFMDRGSQFHYVVRPEIDAVLHAELERAGYTSAASERAMTLLSPRPPVYSGPLSIREAGDNDIQAYGGNPIGVSIARTAIQLGFVLLAGEYAGRTVARSMTVVSGALAGIYNVSVEPEFRRRGFGEAITWAAVEAGSRRGATMVWLGSTEMAQSLYRRMGFEDRFEYLHLEAGSRI